jgi:hypothetical protein
MKLSREDFRRMKGFSKEEMENWLQIYYNSLYNNLRKSFNDAYKDELDNSVQNFITALAYTLHFSDEVNLQHDELNSFMEDLFVSVEMFRKGEYNPEEYREQLREDGIEIAKYDYDKLYREKDAPYKEKYDKLVKFLEETKSKAKVIDEIKAILK